MSSEELTPAANCQPSTAILKLNNTTAVTPTTSTELNLYKKSSSNSLFYSTLGGGEVEVKSGGDTGGVTLQTVNGNLSVGVSNGSIVGTKFTNVIYGVANVSALDTGSSNCVLGYSNGTLLTTGSGNTLVGVSVGSNLTTGSNNLLAGTGTNVTTGTFSKTINVGYGAQASASNQIRIGGVDHTTCYIGGISGRTTTVDDAVPVLISSGGQLGTTSSSLRYKTNVQDIKDYSSGIYDLRPVTFKWKPEHNPSTKVQVGLIAEEVAETFPSLAVIKDDQPETVAYQNLVPLLLNELQKLKKRLDQAGL